MKDGTRKARKGIFLTSALAAAGLLYSRFSGRTRKVIFLIVLIVAALVGIGLAVEGVEKTEVGFEKQEVVVMADGGGTNPSRRAADRAEEIGV